MGQLFRIVEWSLADSIFGSGTKVQGTLTSQKVNEILGETHHESLRDALMFSHRDLWSLDLNQR
jgi:hypothetical protein